MGFSPEQARVMAEVHEASVTARENSLKDFLAQRFTRLEDKIVAEASRLEDKIAAEINNLEYKAAANLSDSKTEIIKGCVGAICASAGMMTALLKMLG